MSLLICVPTFETIATETYKSLWEQEECGQELMFDTVKGYDCARARIKACEKAIDYGVEWLLMVDSDTVLPNDALANLLEHDKDIVLGYYQFKIKGEGETCLWKYGDWSSRYSGNELHALNAAGTNLVRVQGGGMGCTLLRVKVLDKLPYPWFEWKFDKDGTDTGEDVYFFTLCKKANIPVFVDTRVACGHVYRSNHVI